MFKALIENQFARYIIASAIALFVDFSSYWVIVRSTNLALPIAAAMGYSVGLIVAYFLIAGPVFKDGWFRKKKFFELGLFFVSGVVGVTLTYVTVFLYVRSVGEHLHISKLIAIIVSFISVYLFRKYIVFRQLTTKNS